MKVDCTQSKPPRARSLPFHFGKFVYASMSALLIIHTKRLHLGACAVVRRKATGVNYDFRLHQAVLRMYTQCVARLYIICAEKRRVSSGSLRKTPAAAADWRSAVLGPAAAYTCCRARYDLRDLRLQAVNHAPVTRVELSRSRRLFLLFDPSSVIAI